jgi:hypothetical protein
MSRTQTEALRGEIARCQAARAALDPKDRPIVELVVPAYVNMTAEDKANWDRIQTNNSFADAEEIGNGIFLKNSDANELDHDQCVIDAIENSIPSAATIEKCRAELAAAYMNMED